MNQQTFQYKRYESGTYLRVMMQDTSTQILFKNKTEARHYVSNEYSKYKFSILDMLQSISRYDKNKYEFIMCYPELSACNHWTQTKSPLDHEESNQIQDSVTVGLQQKNPRFSMFKGLMLSNSGAALLHGDGNGFSNWAYAAGVFVEYANFIIPGPNLDKKWLDVHSFSLYVRVPRINYLSSCNKRAQFSFIFISFLVF